MVTQGLDGKTLIGSGTTSSLDGAYLKGVITEVGVGNSTIKVKVNSYIDAAGTETRVDYTLNSTWSFAAANGSLGVHTNGYSTAYESTTYDVAVDWFDAQTIEVSSWRNYHRTVIGGTTLHLDLELPHTLKQEIQDMMKFML